MLTLNTPYNINTASDFIVGAVTLIDGIASIASFMTLAVLQGKTTNPLGHPNPKIKIGILNLSVRFKFKKIEIS